MIAAAHRPPPRRPPRSGRCRHVAEVLPDVLAELARLRVPDDEADRLAIRILKNTKGASGATIDCEYDGAKMQIRERAKDTEPSETPRAFHPDP